MFDFIYLRDVVTLALDEERCVGCGMCLLVCPHEVFAMNGRSARIADRDACMECGACAQNCPVGAVSVTAGVGCAAAVINSMLGRESSSCCCVIEPRDGNPAPCSEPGQGPRKTGCC
ncbi:MAG: 4Fe-4S binding protein [Deltaproteobacteria bacterium]|nr:4Fe-4S binding protein [Deltaproteobacteria bacterium]